MTIKILPSERDTLKKICTLAGVEVFFHENELKSEDTGLQMEYIQATVDGLESFEHVWHLCRSFSLEIEVNDLKKSTKG
jgi:hypothetical protein